MTKFAQVVVDVPTLQTNRPYDYAIPAALTDTILPGMRVVVPFGKGGRRVQGFVTALTTQQHYDGDLKAIDTLVDLRPALNTELLQLSKWMADTTYSFWISCMQTMLPNVMRAKYEKAFRIQGTIPEQIRTEIFHNQAELLYSEDLSDQTLRTLSKLQQAGQLETVYHVKNRARVKTQTMVTTVLKNRAAFAAASAALRKNAAKQFELLAYLERHPETVPLKQAEDETKLSRAIFTAGAKKGWLELSQQEVYRDPTRDTQIEQTQPLQLTADQKTAVDAVVAASKNGSDRTFLLEGVTGSGKTEVYLQIMAAALAHGKTALMLVPEIALTPQMVNRVKGRFGDLVAVLHSGLSEGEKYDEWRRIERHEAKVVVGARSAVFAPLENLGVLIMDEEHESSYKQDESPRYHARDVAIWRGQYNHCPVLLGSATPSLESRARAQKGVYQLLRLPERINGQPLPQVTLIDMKAALRKNKNGNFSPQLLTALQGRLIKHEQSVLMLNRRGFSSFVMCRDCGFVLKCPNCDISLTLHMDTHSMRCHYCGHEEPIPQICPNCHSHKIRYYGTGTEKVEKELQELLPEARILRMDVDTTRKKGAHERILQQFGSKEADILLGTQMIAKGLDFPDVTLVGVINADTALGLPDFRASERTFQLLTQVSGRAGRANKEGKVIIQTFNPEHYAIQFAQRQDYEGFYRHEMQIRHRGNYSPYYYSDLVQVSHEDEGQAAKMMFEIANRIKPILSDQAIILGPTPRSIARINKKYYYQIVIKYKHEPRLHAKLEEILETTQTETRHGFQIVIDHEPQQFT
ncbi:primosomal protein N [Lactobacillus selangorensis]|uniref:Replication restart protein PriA n=1 Tax=Lactobacillus selangorensis TaxID=81857 RepID=A0A0R2FM45_9LACO|nr:primosomal protein N' [Lactobacillus selangorensis]KRN29651.1 primosomal protein N [Lactobacillus selangorensis]KRN33820.1 primosomal protein N [Lactobacillus selangorensis]